MISRFRKDADRLDLVMADRRSQAPALALHRAEHFELEKIDLLRRRRREGEFERDVFGVAPLDLEDADDDGTGLRLRRFKDFPADVGRGAGPE